MRAKFYAEPSEADLAAALNDGIADGTIIVDEQGVQDLSDGPYVEIDDGTFFCFIF